MSRRKAKPALRLFAEQGFARTSTRGTTTAQAGDPSATDRRTGAREEADDAAGLREDSSAGTSRTRAATVGTDAKQTQDESAAATRIAVRIRIMSSDWVSGGR